MVSDMWHVLFADKSCFVWTHTNTCAGFLRPLASVCISFPRRRLPYLVCKLPFKGQLFSSQEQQLFKFNPFWSQSLRVISYSRGNSSMHSVLYTYIVWKHTKYCLTHIFQVNGKCPTVSIDKTDGCQVYLSKDSLTCEIVTAKSSEMNICVPQGGDGEFVSFLT